MIKTIEKPKKNFVNVVRREGNFNLLNPSEEGVNYSFKFPHLTKEQIKELGLRTFFIIKEEEDDIDEDETPLDIAYSIRDIIHSYLINTNKDDIDKLVEYLESIEGEQEQLRQNYEIEYAEYQVNYWTERLDRLKEETK